MKKLTFEMIEFMKHDILKILILAETDSHIITKYKDIKSFDDFVDFVDFDMLDIFLTEDSSTFIVRDYIKATASI